MKLIEAIENIFDKIEGEEPPYGAYVWKKKQKQENRKNTKEQRQSKKSEQVSECIVFVDVDPCEIIQQV